MLTQCPSCQTTFRVTSEILRVAHGQVRCGRCQTQFDALERLIEEADVGEIQSGRYLRPGGAAEASPSEGNIEVEEPSSHEDITLEGRRIEITGTYRVIDENTDGEQIREHVTEEWVEIDDLDEHAAGAQLDAQEPRADDTQDVEDHEDELTAGIEVEEAQDEAGQHALTQPAQHAGEEAGDFDFLPGQPRRATARIWKVLAAPLVLLLLAQLVHNYRYTLARHPVLGPPLIRLYGTLGMTLRPDWNLHAYEILQWHVGSDPATPGTLRVRATIRNLAPFAQPYPLLKLVLEDRWGEQVRAREFEPAEYLDPAIAPDRLLAPAQQANATIAIVDPGPDAEGFRFDVCLRGASGPVCAADVPGRR